MEAQLRAGIAIYNAGDFHAAHDAWEDCWLDLADGTDDERFLHGLIQFTAAVHHAHDRNWGGATGLAESATSYLDGLGTQYRGVDLAPIRDFLATLAVDPAVVERRSPPRLTHQGSVVTLPDLLFAAGAVAARVYAEQEGYDEAVIDRAIAYGNRDLEADEATSPFVTLVLDFAREADSRGIVIQRLSEHVERRKSREEDVAGLFE